MSHRTIIYFSWAFKKAKLLKSPHAKSRAYRLMNTIETAGNGDVQVVKDFRPMLDHEEKDGLKELDASYYRPLPSL